MNHRERHTPADGGPGAAPPAATAGPPGLWEEWFICATPSAQLQALDLAHRQGVVYAHQLPAAAAAPCRQTFLTALLQGQLGDLPPFRTPLLEPSAPGLDSAQREAVARALHTPDICLIQGFPGSGKSHVAAELLARAAQRGERVLFAAATGAALDQALESLTGAADLFPVRCLGPEENPERLAPTVRRFLFSEHMRRFREETLAFARKSVEDCLADLARFEREKAQWEVLKELAQSHESLANEQAQLAERQVLLSDAAADPPSPSAAFLESLAECRRRTEESVARWDERLRTVRTEVEKTRAQQQSSAAALERLRPLVEARQGYRWWKPVWWLAMLQGDLANRVTQLQRSHEELASVRARLEEELTSLTTQRADGLRDSQAELDTLRRREQSLQLAAVEVRRADLQQKQTNVAEAWSAAQRAFRSGTDLPAPITLEAVQQAASSWQHDHDEAGRHLGSAEKWLLDAVEASANLSDRLVGCTNLVAVPAAALARDPHFGDAKQALVFDLLVLDDAELIAEADFLALARRARRWVLLGTPSPAAEFDRRKPAETRLGFFQRLWKQIHPDPRRLRHRWSQRDGTLTCHLRFLSLEQQRWLQSEPVADRPEIGLRIIAQPRQQPYLAEVVFPTTISPSEAKEFLFRELEELAVQSEGPAAHWEEGPDRVVLRLAPLPDPDAVAAVLGYGIRERIGCRRLTVPGSIPWQTCCLEFDRSAGWDRDRAEGWIAQHLGWRDSGRTAALAVSRRAEPVLANILADLLPDVAALPACLSASVPTVNGTPAEATAVLTFVTVPGHGPEPDTRRSLAESEGRRRQGGTATAPRVRPARGGAGLELDLAEPPRLDALPADVRAVLPRHGLVNFLEAEAVVRTVQTLLADSGFVHAAETWQRQRVPQRSAIAILALYPAQARLLAELVGRSPALARSRLGVEVATPGAFRHRECYAALVSLCRSHTHRAVAYGEGPEQMALALTRAAGQLFLFGDPGTLIRRCQWHGPVDHLGEDAAEREREFFTRVLSYLQGHGPHRRAFRLCEGIGP